MLTRRGKATLACAVLMLIAGRILGITELFGIASAGAALVIAAAVRVRVPLLRAQISARVTPDVIIAGTPAVLELFVENTGISPTAANRLQLVPSGGGRHRVLVPRLAPAERATVTIGIDTTRRGRKGVAGYDAVVMDALGLSSHRVTSSGPISWVVRPRVEELSSTLPLSAGAAGIESTRSAAERLRTGASLLRTYVEGDDLRLIHWATTARIGDLMVREGGDPDYSSRSGTTILVSTRAADGDAFERAIEVAASLATAAEREGNFRLVTTDGQDSGMDNGPGHLEALTLNLATIQPVPPGAPNPSRNGDTPLEALGNRTSSPDDASVLFVVVVASNPRSGEIGPDDVGALPPRSGPVILVMVGGSEPRFERIGREKMAVYMPVAQSLRELWSVATDLPVGEVRSVRSEPAAPGLDDRSEPAAQAV
jgi:uncharacterized protein (DUF58 family)